jgi:hypothetical protein
MSIKELLLNSFVKGIGKTTASVTVFGIIGCAWYLYNYRSSILDKKKTSDENENENENENDQSIESDVLEDEDDDDDKTVNEMDTIKHQLEDIIEKSERINETRNFRKIFDGI